MAQAEMCGRYALTAKAGAGGFTIASLATLPAVGPCSHAFLSFDGRGARLRLAPAQVRTQRRGQPFGLVVIPGHRACRKAPAHPLTIHPASALGPLPPEQASAAVAQW